MFRHFPFPTVVVLLLALPRSAQIFVPADQPTLQDAIDASPSGGTIVVTTAFPQDPVTIDRPINIIGDPVVNIGQRGSSCSGTHEPAVTLAGPGTGIVRLSTAVLTEASDCTPMYPLLTGGGFDALHIFDSTAIEPGTGFQGTGQGAPAILTSVPFVLVSRSRITGGADGIDICPNGNYGPVPYLAYPAIEAPGTVACFDATITGGRILTVLCCVNCFCPDDLTFIGGKGADAIVADEVFLSGGTTSGGSGVEIQANFAPCGRAEDGLAVSAHRLSLPTGFRTGTGQLPLGGSWTLSYLATGVSFLTFDVGVEPPLALGPAGYSFMGADFTTLFALPVNVAGSVSIGIPGSTSLAGLEVVFQIFDVSAGWSRPVCGLLVP